MANTKPRASFCAVFMCFTNGVKTSWEEHCFTGESERKDCSFFLKGGTDLCLPCGARLLKEFKSCFVFVLAPYCCFSLFVFGFVRAG